MSTPRPDRVGSVRTWIHSLCDTTPEPAVRSLYQVRIKHADEAGKTFETLMGDVVEPRREFFQDTPSWVLGSSLRTTAGGGTRTPGGST